MSIAMKNVVGPRIRESRYSYGRRVTQEQLAARLQSLGVDLDRTAISKIETGRRPVTDLEIIAFAKALEVTVPSLFGEEYW